MTLSGAAGAAMGGCGDRGGTVLHLCIPSVPLPHVGGTPGGPHVPMFPNPCVPTSQCPHFPTSPFPTPPSPRPPILGSPLCGAFVPFLKVKEKKSSSRVPRPTELGQRRVGTVPPVSLPPPMCVPPPRRPLSHRCLYPCKCIFGPILAHRGVCGAGEGCVGGSLCVCLHTCVQCPSPCSQEMSAQLQAAELGWV